MVKAFTVMFKQEATNFMFGSQSISSTYPQSKPDDIPILVVANDIKEVADKYPTSVYIVEESVKEVIVLNKIICPVK